MSPDRSTAKRSQTTGCLLLTLPKVVISLSLGLPHSRVLCLKIFPCQLKMNALEWGGRERQRYSVCVYTCTCIIHLQYRQEKWSEQQNTSLTRGETPHHLSIPTLLLPTHTHTRLQDQPIPAVWVLRVSRHKR